MNLLAYELVVAAGAVYPVIFAIECIELGADVILGACKAGVRPVNPRHRNRRLGDRSSR